MIDEQLDGSCQRQCTYRHQHLAGDAQRLTAGGDEPEAGDLSDQGVGQGRRRVDDLLAVVDDNYQGPAGQLLRHDLGR